MGRLCDIRGKSFNHDTIKLDERHMKANMVLFVSHTDENVEVIYVSPVCLGEDVLQYYTHLLGLQTAIELGDASVPESNCAKRFTILMPEAMEYFSVW